MKNEEIFYNNIKLAYKIANKYFINHKNEYEDIKQVALIGLWKAVLTFKNTNAFSTYAYRVIANEINLFLRKNKKHNNTYSLQSIVIDNIEYQDLLEDDYDFTIEYEEESEIQYRRKTLEEVKGLMKETDRKIIELLLQGYKQTEIARILNITQPTVCRVKDKIRKTMTKIEV